MPVDTRPLRGRLEGTRALVVGGGGFLGRHLVPALLDAGAAVYACGRSAAPPVGTSESATWIRHDAADPDATAELLERVRPRVIYLLVSDSRNGRDLDLIYPGLRNDVTASLVVLTEAARLGGMRVILAGSLEEPVGDAGDAVPISPYSAAKWAVGGYARMIASQHGLDVVYLRLMMVYGPGQSETKLVPATSLALLKGEPALLSSGSRELDWVFVDDVMGAFLAAAAIAPPGPAAIDIGTGRKISVRALATMIGTQIGRPDLLLFDHLPDRPMEPARQAETTKAKEILGWEASTDLQEGLGRTIDWLRSSVSNDPQGS